MPSVIENLAERLARMPQVERIILFGSRARGDGDSRSDIDLAVECPTASDSVWRHIRKEVEDASTLLFVDLIRLDCASDELRQNVLREGVVVYER